MQYNAMQYNTIQYNTIYTPQVKVAIAKCSNRLSGLAAAAAARPGPAAARAERLRRWIATMRNEIGI